MSTSALESAEKGLADARSQRLKIRVPIQEAKSRIATLKVPVEEAKKKVDQARQELKTQETNFGIVTEKDRGKLTSVQQSDLDRKKKELDDREKLLRAAQNLLDEAIAPKVWNEDLEKRVKKRIKAYKAQITRNPKKVVLARKVGVWTDDYSNLLSVLNFWAEREFEEEDDEEPTP